MNISINQKENYDLLLSNSEFEDNKFSLRSI